VREGAQSSEAAVYGFAKDKARPIIFGEETVAVWIPDVKEDKGEHARGKLQSSRRRLLTDSPGAVARALRVRHRSLLVRE